MHARLVVVALGMLVLMSCSGGEESFPTRGLSQAQVRSAQFLETEVLLDLRLQDDVAWSVSATSGAIEPGEGWWFVAEGSGRWAVGDRSTLRAYVADPADLHLYLESQGPEVETVHVMVNGAEVGLMTPGPEWGSHGFRLEPGVLHSGLNQIEFAFVFPSDRPPLQTIAGDPETMLLQMFGRQQPSAANLQATLPRIRQVFPGATVHGDDILNLPGIDVADVIGHVNDQGIGTTWQWASVGSGALSVEFRTIALVKDPKSFDPSTRLAGFSRDRGDLTVWRNGRLFIPLDLASPRNALSFAVSTPAGLGRSTVLRATFKADGASRELMEKTLHGLWGTASYRSELDLDGLWGPGCLVVGVDLSTRSGPLSLDVFDVVESPPESAPVRETVAEPPDIVLIVLDAARADHFGSYGYSLDTTPHIDALAAEALVFENAFATASYTLSSMPTMLTGLSFRDHGVVRHTHSLDESITTLAEWLQQGGYRTSCYSANYYNGVARGLGQGCAVFEEFWQNASLQRHIDPYRVSASAIARLAEPSGAPEFLMLHYIPPHEPYQPAPGFDIFGDPNYTGDYDGSRHTVLEIDGGRLHPSQADMDEVVSLYDGNLLTADDAVNQVLEVLRQRERWDNTVVLVVSDHGEAFGEHGRMSHGDTVYDEMLHVPFILRLPGGVVPEQIDTRGLVSLEDVVPTLLGLAGIEPTSQLSGVDLLASRPPRRRGIVARSIQDQPFLAYRTSRWKLITRGGVNALYALGADPGESHNVHLENLESSFCLRSLLEAELTRVPLGAPAAEGVELSDDDVNALRALGYIR